jgi:hypothetical protein
VQSIFTFLLQRTAFQELGAIHEGSGLPLLLYAAVILHRNSMFQELHTLGLGIDDEFLVVKCCSIAVQCCNWSLLGTLLRDGRCNFGPENVTASLLFSCANSLHAPSMLLLLESIRSRCGGDYVKKCINLVTPKGLTILNVLMLLIRSCERDPEAACNAFVLH